MLCVDPDDERLDATVERLRSAVGDFDVSVETAGTVDAATELLTAETAAVVTEYSFPDGSDTSESGSTDLSRSRRVTLNFMRVSRERGS